MNETLKTIKNRRSIRKYKSDAVPCEIIEKIAEAGTYAASGMNRQQTIILAITDKETRDSLARDNASIMGRDSDPFYGAPAVLVVLVAADCFTGVYDGSLVMGNLMLAAHSMGVDSCWIHRAKETFEMPKWKQFLKDQGIEGEYVGIGNCILGYRDTEYPDAPPRKENRVFFVK
jgi:nitroreductase